MSYDPEKLNRVQKFKKVKSSVSINKLDNSLCLFLIIWY